MKKLVVLFLLLMLCGCGEIEHSYYDDIIEEMSFINKSSSDFSFDVNVNLELVGEEYLYYVIIDNPSIVMRNIRALVIGGEDVSSIGFLDNPVNMNKYYIDKDNGYVEGIILSSYIEKNIELKIYIEYENENGDLIKNYYIYNE